MAGTAAKVICLTNRGTATHLWSSRNRCIPTTTDVDGTCAVTGGYVYRGIAYPSMQGIYFFGDYCQGDIRGLQQETGSWVEQNLLPTGFNILGFGEDQAGELYVAVVDPAASGNTGRVLKIMAGP